MTGIEIANAAWKAVTETAYQAQRAVVDKASAAAHAVAEVEALHTFTDLSVQLSLTGLRQHLCILNTIRIVTRTEPS